MNRLNRRKRNLPDMRMRSLRFGLLLALSFSATAVFAQTAPTTTLETPERHEFVIHNFHTESGAVLPEAHIVYGTYGHLNAAHDNAMLLPSHYMATLRGYEWLMGPDKA